MEVHCKSKKANLHIMKMARKSIAMQTKTLHNLLQTWNKERGR